MGRKVSKMKYCLGLICSLIVISGFSQSSMMIDKGENLTTDQFGNYYLVGQTEIKKYNRHSELQYTYSNNVLGEIATVDVFDPLKILVYFRDFTKVLVLDNMLAPTSNIIDLTELELEETSLVCRSYNNSIWYYNPVKFELIRKGNDLITTNNSGNLATLLGKNIQPNFLVEYNNRVYLNDPVNGVLVFDIYGTYLKTIPLFNLNQFQVKDKYILYVNEQSQIERYDFFTLGMKTYHTEKYREVKLVRIENNFIYVVDKNYKLTVDKIQE